MNTLLLFLESLIALILSFIEELFSIPGKIISGTPLTSITEYTSGGYPTGTTPIPSKTLTPLTPVGTNIQNKAAQVSGGSSGSSGTSLNPIMQALANLTKSFNVASQQGAPQSQKSATPSITGTIGTSLPLDKAFNTSPSDIPVVIEPQETPTVESQGQGGQAAIEGYNGGFASEDGSLWFNSQSEYDTWEAMGEPVSGGVGVGGGGFDDFFYGGYESGNGWNGGE